MTICPREWKERFGKEWAARRALRSLSSRSQRIVGIVYRCPYCQGWHLGSGNTRRKALKLQDRG